MSLTLAPGLILAGRFELGRRLGAGGLGEVFAARDLKTGEEVALKALLPHLCGEAPLVDRFRRELRMTRGLDHSGIVRVYDLHAHEERVFFSMELLRGRTLADRLREGALPAEEARRIAIELAQALEAAHRGGIVHRDVKPQNIFLCATGPVKLLDFGLARAAGLSRLTAQSTVLGTPGYLAPELLLGQPADGRADVFSLGATLFEMLTGHRAFNTADPLEALRLQQGGPPELVAAPADRALVRRMLQAEPALRFSDLGQVLRALRGGEVAPALPGAPPLVGGSWEVVVRRRSGWGRGLREVARVLGVSLTPAARARLLLSPSLWLAHEASERTARELRALCERHGVPAVARPAPRRSVLGRLFGDFWAFLTVTLLLLLTGSLVIGLLAVLTVLAPIDHQVADRIFGWLEVAWLIACPLLGGLTTWGRRGLLRGLPEGDPGLLQLLQGIERRLALLTERARQRPQADQGLLEAAGAAAQVARRIARAPVTDELASEAVTLEPGAPPPRDAVAQELLRVTAALDEALAVQNAAPPPALEAASAALRLLRDQIEQARKQ